MDFGKKWNKNQKQPFAVLQNSAAKG